MNAKRAPWQGRPNLLKCNTDDNNETFNNRKRELALGAAPRAALAGRKRPIGGEA